KVQSAMLLLNIRHPEADDLIGELLAGSDFHTAFAVLDNALGHLSNDHLEGAFGLETGKQRFESLLEIVRRRHGDLADLIPPVFEEVQRQQNLIQRRGQITESEHRFFLALLLNVPDRLKILDLVRQRYPDQNPVTTIVDWVEELANTKLFGSPEPNVLGINDLDDEYLFVLQCMLEGLPIEQIRNEFSKEFSVVSPQSSIDKSDTLYEEIHNSMMFKTVVIDSMQAIGAGQSRGF